MGERGMAWYDENGEVRHMPALNVPAAAIVDTNGAGDVFHGAYMYAFLVGPRRQLAIRDLNSPGPLRPTRFSTWAMKPNCRAWRMCVPLAGAFPACRFKGRVIFRA